ncbi:YchJ family protein [Flavobacterium sp. ZS1P70]|uniref:YchJ family protein n=1 Tax=Flavobacterium zhoui TaxID=3230414 RepID=A0ABW6I9X9_9FLAO
MIQKKCYCGSFKTFKDCCEPFINESKKAPTALTLMQSRYSAYATLHVDYLMATTHFSKRKYHSKSEILNWAGSNQWLKLEIINATANTVEFKAYFLDRELQKQIHHERSAFICENGSWFYVDGEFFN